MDVRLLHMNGIETTRRLKALAPRAEVVIMSFYEDYRYREDAETAGASAFVPKRTIPIELASILTKYLAQPIDSGHRR
jgi:DNA-binding NarL/FixJ family response regulator